MEPPPAKRRKPAPRRSARLQSGGAAAASPSAERSSAIGAADDGQRGAKRKRGGASGAAAVVPASVAKRAKIDAQLAPLRGQARDELQRKEDEMERRYAAERAALERRYAEERAVLEREDTELGRRIAPLQAQRDEVDGYLQLVHAQPSPRPADLPADTPPTILLAAQRRLAVAGIGSARRHPICDSFVSEFAHELAALCL